MAQTQPTVVLIATRKGAFFLHEKEQRTSWQLSEPLFLGHMVHHMVQDPRDPSRLLLAARTGHLGPTVFRSKDFGRQWFEARKPPAFPKAADGESGRVVDHVFWLTPGHADEPGVWYAGTSPQGLFRSEDHGESWESVAGFDTHPLKAAWVGNTQDGTPDGPKLHSVLVDPRDARHLYLGMSSGGVHESLDRGATWRPLIGGLQVVEPMDATNIAFHDPHCVRLCPTHPDRLYQQNHCGIYRLDRPGETWVRIGNNMPREEGDAGFPMVVHPRDADTCFVFPMDGTDVWPRTSPGGKPAVYRTRDAGASWTRLDRGLPQAQAWMTVKRQAMAADSRDPLGLYFGTTNGELWNSRDEGDTWQCAWRNLQHVYAVETAVTPS